MDDKRPPKIIKKRNKNYMTNFLKIKQIKTASTTKPIMIYSTK